MKYRNIQMLFFLFACIASAGVFYSCASAPAVASQTASGIRYWNDGMKMKAMTVSDDALTVHELPVRSDPRIAVMMYHNIVFGRTGNEYNRDIYNFEHDLVFLLNRYRIIDFGELLDLREGRSSLVNDAAVITFDDGDLSMYAIAFPLLKEYGIKATFFIIADFVGEIGYMNWAQIKEIADYRTKSGETLFTIGSHGLSHLYLGEVDTVTVFRELSESKTKIESNIGRKVEFLALPFGSGAGNEELIGIARYLGYTLIRTSDLKVPSLKAIDPMRVPGIYVDNVSTDKIMQKLWAMSGH